MRWLVRAYYTAYTAGQILPTSIGGDAMRIYETSRRHPGNGGPIAGTALLERALGGAAMTLEVQSVRVLSIWHDGLAVDVHLSPRPYYVMGPLLFLVMLVPFTINGLAVREAFFVSFLGQLNVGNDPAFATGFVFFLVTVALALPGAVVLSWESLRGGRQGSAVDATNATRPGRAPSST